MNALTELQYKLEDCIRFLQEEKKHTPRPFIFRRIRLTSLVFAYATILEELHRIRRKYEAKDHG